MATTLTPPERTFDIGDKVFYFGSTPHSDSREGVVAFQHPDGRTYTVNFADQVLFIQGSELHPARPLDADVQKMNWEGLQNEVMRWRVAARYLLSQEGDDLCWRDWYLLFARLLPEVIDKDNTRTLPPKTFFLKNCERFCDSLNSPQGMPYCPRGYDDKDLTIAELQKEVFELKAKLVET